MAKSAFGRGIFCTGLCLYFTSGTNFILKQIAIICLFTIIMYLYYKVSIGKALVLSALYQGLLLFVDYIAYIVNSSIFLKKTVLQTSETLTKSLIIVFGKILLFFMLLLH